MPVPHVDVFGLTKLSCPLKIVFFLFVFGKFEDHTVQTGSRRFVIRNLRLSNYLIHVSFFPSHLSRRVTGTFCFARWGGVVAFSKIAQILISRRFLAVLDVPNCYGTSPLGPLVLGLGLGVLHGAKHSLPGSLLAKMGVKTCDVSGLIKSTRNIHFKGR